MQYLDPEYLFRLYCVNASQFPFYIYYYIYTVKWIKLVYGLPIQIVNEYKEASLHSNEKRVYRAQQIAKRWKINLIDIWEKWNNEKQY